jgi:hypothetical protein
MAGAAVAAATPEEALQDMQAAYQREDLDAAVAARDFEYEARAELLAERDMKTPDAELLQHTAQVLELAFRKQIKLEGFPDEGGANCALAGRKVLRADLVELVRECVNTNGDRSRQTLTAARSASGWRMVVLPR